MHLGHIELFAQDVAASKDFYCRFFGCEPVVDQGNVVWVKSGLIELAMRPHTGGIPGSSYGQTGPALVFYTEDLAGDLSRLAAAGVQQAGCDGQECCPLFRDPDGNWIQLVDLRDQH